MITAPYIILDLETTNKNKGEDAIGEFSASPWHVDNKIVLMGTKIGDSIITRRWAPKAFSEEFKHIANFNTILVGHNIKFDLHYLMRHDYGFYHEIVPKIKIWDTQLVEYLITAHQSKWASLDSVSEKYGGTLKDSAVKDFWESGLDTEDIPIDLLHEYLVGDLNNTEKVFLAQLDIVQKLGMENIVRTQMEALLATTEMEFNGMYFDRMLAEEKERELDAQVKHLKSVIEAVLNTALGIDDANADSKDHLSLFLFGGKLKYKERIRDIDVYGNPAVYKTGANKGLPKYKTVEKERSIKGVVAPLPSWELKKKGFYSTTEDVLKQLLDRRLVVTSFINDILTYRRLAKDVGTYYKGYTKLVWPNGFIHGELNHTTTNTGRLSSSRPNLQNLNGED